MTNICPALYNLHNNLTFNTVGKRPLLRPNQPADHGTLLVSVTQPHQSRKNAPTRNALYHSGQLTQLYTKAKNPFWGQKSFLGTKVLFWDKCYNISYPLYPFETQRFSLFLNTTRLKIINF
jgi:hypothetical protein